jgi:SagB-type dehydrogenase family enzyme
MTQTLTGPVRQRAGLRSGVELVDVPGGYELRHPWGRHRLSGLSPDECDLLRRLTTKPAEDREIAASRLRPLLLELANLVTITLTGADDDPILTVTPISRSARVLAITAPGERTVTLSRFAYLRRGATSGLSIESPVSAHRIELHDPTVAAFVGALSTPSTVTNAAARTGIDDGLARVVTSILAAAGMLDHSDEALKMWEFQDLLFHQRSRYGQHDYPAGGMFSHPDTDHAPAQTPLARTDVVIDLPVPDWSDVVSRDTTLTEVIEGRSSSRQYASVLTRDQLGELLYRTARARRIRWTSGEHAYESVDRPYPTGGGLGELEIYLAIHNCDGVPASVYRYDSAGHRLVLRNSDPSIRLALAAQAWLATGGQTVQPQVQFCVTSRLDRLQWKYSAIAYGLTLKHVGVLFQNLYLVSTAMGLSPCGNGSGDSELMAQAIGVDWTREAAVGEFLLGGAPAQPAEPVVSFVDLVAQTR